MPPLPNNSVFRTPDPSGDKFLMKLLPPDLNIQAYAQVDENGDMLGVPSNPTQVNDNAVLAALAGVAVQLSNLLAELTLKFNTTDTLSVVTGGLEDVKTTSFTFVNQNVSYPLPAIPKTGRKLLMVTNNNVAGFVVLGNLGINAGTVPPVGVMVGPGQHVVISASDTGLWFGRASVAGLQITITEQS